MSRDAGPIVFMKCVWAVCCWRGRGLGTPTSWVSETPGMQSRPRRLPLEAQLQPSGIWGNKLSATMSKIANKA
jgi:hypothetical protein